LGTMALLLAFVTAYLADAAGSALIIGAFAAGLILAPTPQAKPIQRGVVTLGQFFVPIFFVSVGAAVEVQSFLQPGVLAIGLTLIAVAIIGKVAAGYAPVWFKGKKSVIGVGMVPRGEVGLIFAQMGLTSGVLDAGLFSALTLMVMVTTFIAPPLLKALFPKRAPAGPPPGGVAEMTTEAQAGMGRVCFLAISPGTPGLLTLRGAQRLELGGAVAFPAGLGPRLLGG